MLSFDIAEKVLNLVEWLMSNYSELQLLCSLTRVIVEKSTGNVFEGMICKFPLSYTIPIISLRPRLCGNLTYQSSPDFLTNTRASRGIGVEGRPT